MRDKKCNPSDTFDELPILSIQEEKLVEAVAVGHDNSTAYRMAYGADGYNPNALKVRACRKIAEPKIQAHLRTLRAVGSANINLTLETRIKEEQAFAQRAEDAGNWGAAGGAHDRINKLCGLYIEKHQEVGAQHDVQETLNDIARLVGEEYAVSKAKAYGIQWKPPTELVNTRH